MDDTLLPPLPKHIVNNNRLSYASSCYSLLDAYFDDDTENDSEAHCDPSNENPDSNSNTTPESTETETEQQLPNPTSDLPHTPSPTTKSTNPKLEKLYATLNELRALKGTPTVSDEESRTSFSSASTTRTSASTLVNDDDRSPSLDRRLSTGTFGPADSNVVELVTEHKSFQEEKEQVEAGCSSDIASTQDVGEIEDRQGNQRLSTIVEHDCESEIPESTVRDSLSTVVADTIGEETAEPAVDSTPSSLKANDSMPDSPPISDDDLTNAPTASLTRSKTKALRTLGIISQGEADKGVLANEKAMKLLGISDISSGASRPSSSIFTTLRWSKTEKALITGTPAPVKPKRIISPLVDHVVSFRNSAILDKSQKRPSLTIVTQQPRESSSTEHVPHQTLHSGFIQTTKHSPHSLYRSWKRRYAILTPGFLHLYNEHHVLGAANGKEPSDVLYVGVGTVVKILYEAKRNRLGFGFNIKSGGKVYYFWCDDMSWLEHVEKIGKEPVSPKTTLERMKEAEEKKRITLLRNDSGVSVKGVSCKSNPSTRMSLDEKLLPPPPTAPPTLPLPPIPTTPQQGTSPPLIFRRHSIHTNRVTSTPSTLAPFRRSSTSNLTVADAYSSPTFLTFPPGIYRRRSIRRPSICSSMSPPTPINSAIMLLDRLLVEEKRRSQMVSSGSSEG